MSGRNTILITADSVRADYTGFLNPALDTTPYLAELAKSGLVFENAVAPGPRTPSSMPVVFTGEPMPVPGQPLEDKGHRIDRIKHHMRSHRSVATRFKEAGYTTIGVSTNPWTMEHTDFDDGFDVFEAVTPPSYSNRYPFKLPYVNRLYHTRLGGVYRHVMNYINNDKWYSQWPTFYDRTVESVSDVDEPFFLWIFLLDSHNPYLVPRTDRVESSTVGMYTSVLRANSMLTASKDAAYKDSLPTPTELNVKKAYRDSIRSVDRFVKTIHTDLETYDPVLVFHSDHGEAFGEHGTYGHQSAMHSENLRVPLLIHGSAESGRIRETFSLSGLPDLLVRCSIEEESPTFDSDYAMAQDEDGEKFAIRNRKWKLILDDTGSEPERRLYDLQNDPGENVNVMADNPEAGAELEEILNGKVAEKEEVDASDGEVADSVEEHLESLGYK